MPKISRPIVYSLVGAVAVYAVFLYTQPDKPTARTTVRMAHTAPRVSSENILPEDLNAHFPRYAGGGGDSFTPGVVVAKPKAQASATSKAGGIRTGWALTGINSVNGVASALIENGGTGESVFLQPGDRWNGLRVVAIRADAVVFQNALGRQDTLTFAVPDDTQIGGRVATGVVSVPRVPRLPGLGTASALAPYPVAPLRIAPLPPLQNAPEPPDNPAFPPPDFQNAQ